MYTTLSSILVAIIVIIVSITSKYFTDKIIIIIASKPTLQGFIHYALLFRLWKQKD